jgi:hypothetical protein
VLQQLKPEQVEVEIWRADALEVGQGLSSELTGCEFSAAQELLVVGTEEGHSSIRERRGQKNAEDSGAQPGTKRR